MKIEYIIWLNPRYSAVHLTDRYQQSSCNISNNPPYIGNAGINMQLIGNI